jgi:hypothetical protein
MVLGGTVGELKHRMSAGEFGRWVEYFNKYGRVNPIRMFDFGPALLAWRIDSALGGKSEIKHYMPYGMQDEAIQPDELGSISDIIKEFGGVKPRGI